MSSDTITIPIFLIGGVIIPLVVYAFRQNTRLVKIEDTINNSDFKDLQKTVHKIDKDMAVLMSHFNLKIDSKI